MSKPDGRFRRVVDPRILCYLLLFELCLVSVPSPSDLTPFVRSRSPQPSCRGPTTLVKRDPNRDKEVLGRYYLSSPSTLRSKGLILPTLQEQVSRDNEPWNTDVFNENSSLSEVFTCRPFLVLTETTKKMDLPS